jgi:predicted nucleic acid-binding protein
MKSAQMPVKPLTELADKSVVLIDANIFVYPAGGVSRQCQELLERCAREEVCGFTTFGVLAEACHQLMLANARASGVPQANAKTLRRHRQKVRQLGGYWPTVEALLDSNLVVLKLDEAIFRRAQVMQERYGLLANDSLVFATADIYGITCLVTPDDDFDDVPWLSVYKPGDIL